MALAAVVAAAAFGSALLRERGVRGELESVTGRFASALLTYDSNDLQQARARIRPLVTDKFFANYDSTLEGLAILNAKAEGKAIEVFVADAGADRASTIVVTDSTAERATGTTTKKGAYLRLYLVRDGGAWKVDSVVELSPGRSERPADAPEE